MADDIVALVAVGEFYIQEIKDYYWDLKKDGFINLFSLYFIFWIKIG